MNYSEFVHKVKSPHLYNTLKVYIDVDLEVVQNFLQLLDTLENVKWSAGQNPSEVSVSHKWTHLILRGREKHELTYSTALKAYHPHSINMSDIMCGIPNYKEVT